MNRILALAEWQKARQSLRASQVLVRDQCYEDSVSRSYYAMFHAAKAALYVHDTAAQSHAAVRRLFGLKLIKSCELDSEYAGYLGKTADERLAADYDVEVTFTEKQAREESQRAQQFVRRIRRYLREKGFSESELRKKKP